LQNIIECGKTLKSVAEHGRPMLETIEECWRPLENV
jgi:hypothetical protein